MIIIIKFNKQTLINFHNIINRITLNLISQTIDHSQEVLLEVPIDFKVNQQLNNLQITNKTSSNNF
jgi:hypothetical protein